MRNIKLKIQLARNENHKRYIPETYREEFLNDSGIDVTSRSFCTETFVPMYLGNILDEEKFTKYIAENDVDYEIVQ